MRHVNFKAGGLKLNGHLFLAERPKPVAFLFLAGWTGKQNVTAAAALATHGYSSMTFDMPGHGDSQGKLDELTFADFLSAAETAYDYFKGQLELDQRICLSGASFGSYMAALLSTKRPVSALSLRVPANYPDERFDEITVAVREEKYALEEWRLRKATFKDNIALQAVHDFGGPVQIIRAEQDEMVAAQTVENYVAAAKHNPKLEYIVWEGAPHSIGLDDKLQKEFEKFLLDWADKI